MKLIGDIESKRLQLAAWLALKTGASISEMLVFANTLQETNSETHADYIISVARGYCVLRDRVEKATCFDELIAIKKKIQGTPYLSSIQPLINLKEHFLCQDDNQPFPFYHGRN
jgi:hypothetical protein